MKKGENQISFKNSLQGKTSRNLVHVHRTTVARVANETFAKFQNGPYDAISKWILEGPFPAALINIYTVIVYPV